MNSTESVPQIPVVDSQPVESESPPKGEICIPGIAGAILEINKRFNLQLDKEELSEAGQAIVDYAKKKEEEK